MRQRKFTVLRFIPFTYGGAYNIQIYDGVSRLNDQCARELDIYLMASARLMDLASHLLSMVFHVANIERCLSISIFSSRLKNSKASLSIHGLMA